VISSRQVLTPEPVRELEEYVQGFAEGLDRPSQVTPLEELPGLTIELDNAPEPVVPRRPDGVPFSLEPGEDVQDARGHVQLIRHGHEVTAVSIHAVNQRDSLLVVRLLSEPAQVVDQAHDRIDRLGDRGTAG